MMEILECERERRRYSLTYITVQYYTMVWRARV